MRRHSLGKLVRLWIVELSSPSQLTQYEIITKDAVRSTDVLSHSGNAMFSNLSKWWKHLDVQTRLVITRFAWKILIILGFAGAQSPLPWGFWRSLYIMLVLSGGISCGIALRFREPAKFGNLSYWDEAMWFFFLALIVHWAMHIQ